MTGSKSSKPKILFVYDLNPKHIWMDGLYAALNLLEEDFEIHFYNLSSDDDEKKWLEHPPYVYDFILGWGAFGGPVDKYLQQNYPTSNQYKTGLCIAGNAWTPEGANNYDVLFYETKWYRPQIDFHRNIIHAFGVNTDVFYKVEGLPTPIVWDYIGVGAFADWKRWELMKNKEGKKIVLGYYQDNNEAESYKIVSDLLKNDVMVSNQINPLELAWMYQLARKAYVPANINGGGERSVLEARACGLEVEIEDDNPKLKELLEGPIYDHHYYAKQLKKGILSCL